MSNEATAWAQKQNPSKKLTKYTLTILADCHNGFSNQCNPSIAHIAKIYQLSARAILRHLKSLEADGLIKSQPRYGKYGRLTNQYTLNIEGLPMEDVEEVFIDEENEPIPQKTSPQRPTPVKACAPPPTSSRAPDDRGDMAPIVAQIVIAHPRSRLRNWEPSDVPYTDSVATLQAVDAEAERGKCSRSDAAMMILGSVEAIAQGVPREQWKFIKSVPEFMRLREYRMNPREFMRNGDKNGSHQQDQAARVSPAVQRSRESRANIAAAGKRLFGIKLDGYDGAGAGAVSQPDPSPRDARDVLDRMGGDCRQVRPGAIQGRVIDGNA